MGRRLDLLARKSDGSEFPVEVSLNPFEEQGALHVIAAVRDISHRRHVEGELRANERLLRQMVNSLPALIAFVDSDQRYRFVNTNYGKWFGLDSTQMVGQTAREVMGEESYSVVREKIEEVLKGVHQHSEMIFPGVGGTPRPVEVSHVPHFDDEGEVIGYFVIVLDISERVEAQAAERDHREALAHFSRVATMGELAASIAHELNQPLAAITANAQAARRFLAMTPPDLAEVDDALGDVAGDAKRAAMVIRHMRDLLRKGERREELVDVTSLVRETVQMLLSDAISRNCTIDVKCDGDVPPLSGDRIQLKQVILNLVVNAFEAVSEENSVPGALAIRTSSSKEWVEISVSDNGPGMPDDGTKDFFTPFMTTKPEGLGMGLSISRSIVEAHGGKLVAETNPEGGATLRILLPVPSGEEG
jgi:two-component system sensor kinase FixL